MTASGPGGALDDFPRLREALHPLDAPPRGAGWNLDDVRDLLPPGPPVEAAVLLALRSTEQGTAVLFTRRHRGLRQHGGQVSLPGGRIDPGDADARAAALREAHEEVGLVPGTVRPLGYLDPLATITGYRVLPLVARIPSDFVARPEPGEVDAVFEVPLAFLMTPSNLGHQALEYRGRRREVLEYKYPGQRIWGATASMLLNLRERLQRVEDAVRQVSDD